MTQYIIAYDFKNIGNNNHIYGKIEELLKDWSFEQVQRTLWVGNLDDPQSAEGVHKALNNFLKKVKSRDSEFRWITADFVVFEYNENNSKF